MKSEQPADKRRAARVRSAHMVHAAQQSEGSTEALTGVVVDLSASGLRLQSPAPFPFLAEVDLELALGEDIVRAHARIVHLHLLGNDQFQVGLAFMDLSAADRRRITDFVDRQQA